LIVYKRVDEYNKICYNKKAHYFNLIAKTKIRKEMILPDTKVKSTINGKVGTSKGPVHKYGVWWILVEWENGQKAIVLEQCLEVIK